MMISDFNRIEKFTTLVIADMQKRYPDCHHTIRILLWNDGTSLVECRYARHSKKGMVVCCSTYYDEKLKYHEYLLNNEKIRIDGYGNEHFIKIKKI